MTADNGNPDKTMENRHVTVLGTGVLGSEIAYQTAYCGVPVTAYDISDEILRAAKKRFEALATRFENEVTGAAGGPAQAALTRITCSSSLADAAHDADLVIEAVPEILDLKRKVYKQLGELAPQRTIFATNTSTLLPRELVDSTGRPDRFLAMHFANKIWIHNTTEIVGTTATDPAVYETVVAFARRIEMEPIELHKEQSGYVLNAIAIPWMGAALKLLIRGVADPETIDNTWRIDKEAPEGPFQNMDRVGLKTVYDIYSAGDDEELKAAAAYVKEHYLDKGKLGQPSGEGFYKYAAA
jgi:3-hydroxyacyl-CoA dehydrogenase